VANVCVASDSVLVSPSSDDLVSLTPERPRDARLLEEWAVLFAENGFVRDLDYDATFLSPRATLYRRTEPDLAEAVRAYDRWHWRLVQERDELRLAVDTQRQRLDDAVGNPGGPSVAEMQEAMRAQRDQLIGLEAELGEALGHLAELQAAASVSSPVNGYSRRRYTMARYAVRRVPALGVVLRRARHAVRSLPKFTGTR
jgi:hypothetical protein